MQLKLSIQYLHVESMLRNLVLTNAFSLSFVAFFILEGRNLMLCSKTLDHSRLKLLMR